MTSEQTPIPPTPEEIEETKKVAAEFLAQIEAVPESERVQLSSDKFDGPIGLQDSSNSAERTD